MAEYVERNPNFRWVFLAVLVGLLAAMGGISLWTVLHRPAQVEALTLLPEPKTIPDFTLVDHDGQAFSLASLQDRWSLLFFGYTHCPDVCPNTLFELQRMDELLIEWGDEDVDPFHQVVFVSVDPERDTPDKLKNYVQYFSHGFVGVTGAADQLEALTSELGIAFQIEEHEAGTAVYDVLHSSTVVLMNPDGQLQGAFTAPLFAEKMARDLEVVLN